jgi:UDP-N-acetylmuramoylalanine--D-glutamate ligase
MTLDQDWRGKRVVVVGLGIEGEDLARYFVGRGARVVVTDAKPGRALAKRVAELEPLGVELALGGNDPALAQGAALVCASQSVPLGNPLLAAARAAGVPIASMTGLFLRAWPGPVAAVTGSSGKTTTTLMVDAIFASGGRDHVLGGNLGLGLMSLLGEARPNRWAVLEISHTQLTLIDRGPSIACLTNVTPNHLDQFTWEEYVALKRRIFDFQTAADALVYNRDDPVSRDLAAGARARPFPFSMEVDPGGDGAWLTEGWLWWRREGRSERVLSAAEVPLRGRHNLANAAAATAVAAAAGIEAGAVGTAVRAFRPPPHRLEPVARVRGVDYYNDSIATTPERTLAGLRSFDEPVVLLLGGREKKLPLEDLMREARRRCRGVVCFGEAGPLLHAAAVRTGVASTLTASLAEAVERASALALRGDVVLLSPACTSFDAYENFEQRGADFRALVGRLAAASEARR